jgi:hypothetical protein
VRRGGSITDQSFSTGLGVIIVEDVFNVSTIMHMYDWMPVPKPRRGGPPEQIPPLRISIMPCISNEGKGATVHNPRCNGCNNQAPSNKL